jgi:cytochrome c peroxidase
MRSLAALLLLAGCSSPPAGPGWVWSLPAGFPEPRVPADNAMSEAKVELGRRLFFDVRLSRNGTQSCGTCHEQRRAFTDARPVAIGSTGEHHRRNAQGLSNVAWASALTWANPLVTSLEQQALLPLFGETPVELGWSGHEEELLSRFAMTAEDAAGFEGAFPTEGVTLSTITRALAAFERTLISGQSAWDRYTAGDASALSDDARAGLALFNSERLECYHCHAGFTFSDAVMHAGTGTAVDRPFHNTGLFDVDGLGSYPADDPGVYELTQRVGDMGRFRAPTLRNLRFTAPYMHDGSIATLDEVIDAYAAGGRAKATTGRASPLQSDLVRGFELTTDERRQLLAFLDALNDEAFVTNPALSDPFSR